MPLFSHKRNLLWGHHFSAVDVLIGYCVAVISTPSRSSFSESSSLLLTYPLSTVTRRNAAVCLHGCHQCACVGIVGKDNVAWLDQEEGELEDDLSWLCWPFSLFFYYCCFSRSRFLALITNGLADACLEGSDRNWIWILDLFLYLSEQVSESVWEGVIHRLIEHNNMAHPPSAELDSTFLLKQYQ